MSREASQAAERRLCLLWRTIEQLALLAEQLSGLQGLRPSTGGRKALFSGAHCLLILQGNTKNRGRRAYVYPGLNGQDVLCKN